MCFSASASFATSALLLPIGAYTLVRAWTGDRRYLMLASMPLLFAIQQAFEGGLWLVLGESTAFGMRPMTLGFLAFAYLLWPFYVPLAASRVESGRLRHQVFSGFTLLGLVFGASLYLPLLIWPDWLSVTVVKHSILYQPVLIYDGIVPRDGVRALYAIVVAIPLLFSSLPALRRFGAAITVSVVLSALLFEYAFVSIWCFFAALLSVYLVMVVRAADVQGCVPAARPNPPVHRVA